LTVSLVEKMQEVASDCEIHMAMCYGAPSISDAMEALKKAGVMHLTVLPLYPQYSATTTGAVYDQVMRVLQKWKYLPSLHMINEYAGHPAYIKTLADHVCAFWAKQGKPEQLLLSYHGLPKKQFAAGDPYYCFCHKTTRLLKEALTAEGVLIEMVFQSRFGPSAWLEPSCDEVLSNIAQEGIRRVDVFCPGFAVDCLETIDEIGYEYHALFIEKGGEQLRYIPALNDGDDHVALLLSVAKVCFGSGQ
jgi:ferrochelatase